MKKSEAVKFFGNQTNLAKHIGVAKCTVSKWDYLVPPVWAYRLEKITNGELKANDPWFDNRAA